MAKVTMLVGLPGVGKSTWARKNLNANTKHLSSDSLRVELFGFEDQTRNQVLFREMNKRTKQYLEDGFNVIYDATNLNRKKRKHFINNVVRGYKVECVLFYLDLQGLLDRNWSREERRLPDTRIVEMMKTFQVPLYNEGFEKITYVGEKSDTVIYGGEKVKYENLYSKYDKFDQKTPYHTLTLGKHIEKVAKNIEDIEQGIEVRERKLLKKAAYLHDLGKPLARDYNEETDRAKYIGHENISSYLILPYIQPNTKDGELVHTVVSYHMRAHNVNTSKAKRKLENEIGQEYYELLMVFASADGGAK